MKKLLLALALLLPSIASADSPDLQPDAARLVGSIVVGGHVVDYLRELADGIGPRVTGSPGHKRAILWALGAMTAAGLQHVHVEPFTMPAGWERGTADARLLGSLDRPLHVFAIPWTPSTPRGGVTGEVIILTDISPPVLDALAKDHKLAGKIALLDLSAFGNAATIFKTFSELPVAYASLKQQGVLALLWKSSRPNNVTKVSGLKNPNGKLGLLPAADLGLEDATLIARLLEKGPVRVTVRLDNKISGPVQVDDVIGEVPGSDPSGEWLLVGAHLDSWDFATGAQDNGTGTVMVLEAARAIAALKQTPRRTIRFALWAGEEQGLLGSRAYARNHEGELGKLIAALNTDGGAGAPQGWIADGREDVSAAFKPLAHTLLAGLGGDALSTEVECASDHAPFMLRGVPTLDLRVDGSHYGDIHHLGSDTFDKVVPASLVAGTAVVAVTLWALAQGTERLGPRLDRTGVDTLLGKDPGMCRQLFGD